MARDRGAFTSEVVDRPKAAAPTGFVASAARVQFRIAPGSRRDLVKQAWQEEAWRWFDAIAEYRYACEWVGNLLSKAKLEVFENGAPTKNSVALDAMASFFGGREGQAEALRELGIHFTATGEAYLIGQGAAGEDEDDEWLVAAATEIQRGTEGWRYDERVFDNALVIRLWRPHPRKRSESDSPSRPLLRKLAQIDRLDRHIDAQADSRLIGNGILLLPSEISFATKPQEGEQASMTSASADQFLANFIDVASEAMSDPSSPSAKIPLVLQAAGEHLANIKHLKFWSEMDEKVIELQKEAIRRFALGMDMPPEIIEGTADMNHWGSWMVEEASIKAHTDPLLGVITRSISDGYLRPILKQAGLDASTFSVHADTAEMRLRPNRSKEAVELYDRGELSGAALLRENGFGEEDAMSDDERQMWYARKVAGGSTTPEMVEAALRHIGVDLVVPNADGSIRVQEARPTPSLKQHPTRELPESTEEDALVAAAEVQVGRALERAGNRMKTTHGIKVPSALMAYQVAQLTSADIDEVMQDAFSLVDFGQSVLFKPKHVRAMEQYTASLIASGADHDVTVLRKYLQMAR